MPLCRSCKLFDIHKALTQPPRISAQALRIGASLRCEFCSLLFEKFRSDIQDVYGGDLRVWVRLAFYANDERPLKGKARPGVTALVAWLELPEMIGGSSFRGWLALPIRLLVAADTC
jgi:hypothetical protein